MIPEHLERARQLDSVDPLREFRARFVTAEPLNYLDGNSLGRLPLATQARLREVIDHEWGTRLIRSWPESWVGLPSRVGAKIARLVGASAGEVICADSVSVNLFKLAAAALSARPDRRVIVTADDNFPTDLYIFEGLRRLFPTLEIRFGLDQIDEQTAFVSLSHVDYRSGRIVGMHEVNQRARASGAWTLWDLSHSAGAIQIGLGATGADMAVGCTYKYLNGGPGAPAFLFVRSGLQAQLESPIQGWFGHQSPFVFASAYEPAGGISRFLAGTPSILAMAAVEISLEISIEAGMPSIHSKAIALTDFAIELFDSELAELGFELVTPRQAQDRGSHISLAHPAASQIEQALIANHRIVPDFRPPDILRLGFAPLYVSFEDVADAFRCLRKIVMNGEYLEFPPRSQGVT